MILSGGWMVPGSPGPFPPTPGSPYPATPLASWINSSMEHWS